VTTESLRHLEEEHGREAPGRDLVGERPVVDLKADCLHAVRQIGITQVTPLQPPRHAPRPVPPPPTPGLAPDVYIAPWCGSVSRAGALHRMGSTGIASALIFRVIYIRQ
jgi:hypothetical protein